jgi:bacteriorhodopsin
MGVAFVAASIGAGFAIWSKTKFYFGSGWYGVGAVAVLVVLAIVIRPIPEAEPEAEETAAPEDEPGGAEEA